MIGWLTGLKAEARLLRGLVEVAGAAPEAAVERLVARGASAVVSFGLAGGLDPALSPGALVVPGRVVERDAEFAADPALCAALGGVTAARLLANGGAVATAREKAALFVATGAVAVDMESGAVARVAAAHRLPFAALRAVCDPAGADLPPAALVALDAAGAIGVARVLASVLARPRQIGALLGLARDAAAARRALARAANRI